MATKLKSSDLNMKLEIISLREASSLSINERGKRYGLFSSTVYSIEEQRASML
jgi:hypothetical protein